MKKPLLTIIPLAFAWMAHGQSISPQVVASSGTHFSGGGAQLSWTLGETVTETVSNGSNTITQGFHQTLLTVTSVEEQSESGISVSVYPNPTSDRLNIQLANNKQALQLDLFDLGGKLLESHTLKAEETNLQIGMERYAVANYLLRIQSADASLSNTYKIQKMSAK